MANNDMMYTGNLLQCVKKWVKYNNNCKKKSELREITHAGNFILILKKTAVITTEHAD